MSESATGSALGGALGAIGRRPVAWLAAVLLAGLALGAELLAAISFWSLGPLAEQISIAPEATVLLASGVAASEADALRASLSQLPAVGATRFVSRDAALAQIAARTPADRDAIGQLAGNPLPDVLVVTFRPQVAPDAIDSTAAAIRKMARVDGVEIDLDWYRKFRALARLGAVAMIVVLAAIAIQAVGWLLVAVAVSAPIDPRRVQLLWQLGVDDRGVRGAPVGGAVLTSLAAAVVALAAARAGWRWLDGKLVSIARMYASPARLLWPDPAWLAGFALVVLAVGVMIGSIRARTRLRTIRMGLPGPFFR